MSELSILNSVIDTILLDTVEQSDTVTEPVDIDRLAEDHAKATGKYRAPKYTTCTGCNRQYLNIKYLKYLISNDIRDIDEQTALQLMQYDAENFSQCCAATVMANNDPIVMRVQNIDYKSLVIHYCMARDIELSDELLLRLGVEDVTEYMDSYKSPSIDLDTALTLDEWINSDSTIENLNINIVYDDANDLEIDRYCTYLKACTSCGTPNTYAYLYWMLTLLNVEPEEIFLDYRVYRPCCRSTYMTPIMKPIEYEHERMIQNFTGLERTRRREREETVVTIPGVVSTTRGTARTTRTIESMTAPPKVSPTVPPSGLKSRTTVPSGLKSGVKKAPPTLIPKSGVTVGLKKAPPKKAPAKLTVRR